MGVIINNWGHIITFWGRGFIGGDYHYLGARLLATYCWPAVLFGVVAEATKRVLCIVSTLLQMKRLVLPPAWLKVPAPTHTTSTQDIMPLGQEGQSGCQNLTAAGNHWQTNTKQLGEVERTRKPKIKLSKGLPWLLLCHILPISLLPMTRL